MKVLADNNKTLFNLPVLDSTGRLRDQGGRGRLSPLEEHKDIHAELHAKSDSALATHGKEGASTVNLRLPRAAAEDNVMAGFIRSQTPFPIARHKGELFSRKIRPSLERLNQN